MSKLARIVSHLFGPLMVFSLVLILGALHAGLSGVPLWTFLFLTFGGIILPVTLLRVWLLRWYRIDWDIGDRKKRIMPLLVFLTLLSVNTWVVSLWNNSVITGMFVLSLLWLIGFFLITLVWKISGHTSAITMASLLLTAWYGWQLWPVLLAVPIVAWSRVVGKHHSVGQVIGGIVYSVLLYGFFFTFIRV